jgi:hypothetical protein
VSQSNNRTCSPPEQFGSPTDLRVLTTLWDRQDADFFCLATRRNEVWYHHFFTDFDDLGDVIRDHARHDIYFCVHGFSKPQRRACYALPSKLLWADLDAIDPRSLTIEPTIAWQTSRGRYSAIWRCDEEPTRGLRRGFNAALGEGVDPGWHLTKVLRLWGTRNYKYDPPQRVTLLWDDGPTYRLRDLKKYEADDDGGGGGHASGPIKLLDARRVAAKYKRKFDSDLMDTAMRGKRSDVIWKLGKQLQAVGATADEIATLLYASAAWQSKHGVHSQRVLSGEVGRILAKGVRR